MVLPAPDGPTIAIDSPALTSNDISLRVKVFFWGYENLIVLVLISDLNPTCFVSKASLVFSICLTSAKELITSRVGIAEPILFLI